MPVLELRSNLSTQFTEEGIVLESDALFFDYVIIQGQRYAATSLGSDAPDSLVAVQRASFLGEQRSLAVGKLLFIFKFMQPNVVSAYYGYVLWMKKVDDALIDETVWAELYVPYICSRLC